MMKGYDADFSMRSPSFFILIAAFKLVFKHSKKHSITIIHSGFAITETFICFRLISLRLSIIGRVPNSSFIIGVDAVLLISTSYFFA